MKYSSKNPKITSEEIILYTKLGLSQSFIAKLFGVHQTAIAARLKRLNINTPRSPFMDRFIPMLSEETIEWLSEKVKNNSIEEILLLCISYAKESEFKSSTKESS